MGTPDMRVPWYFSMTLMVVVLTIASVGLLSAAYTGTLGPEEIVAAGSIVFLYVLLASRARSARNWRELQEGIAQHGHTLFRQDP